MNSNLQIISGKWRGKKLKLPKDARPTQNRARIALFNIIEDSIIDKLPDEFIVWDAFAGSGVFGIEVLSRYENSKVIFTDISPETISVIKSNIPEYSGFTLDKLEVRKADALAMVSKIGIGANLIFVDPPYNEKGLGLSFLKRLFKVVKSGTIIIIEMEKSLDLNLDTSSFEVLKNKTYGRANFLLLKAN